MAETWLLFMKCPQVNGPARSGGAHHPDVLQAKMNLFHFPTLSVYAVVAERSKAGDSSSLHLLMARVRTPPTVSFAGLQLRFMLYLFARAIIQQYMDISPKHTVK